MKYTSFENMYQYSKLFAALGAHTVFSIDRNDLEAAKEYSISWCSSFHRFFCADHDCHKR